LTSEEGIFHSWGERTIGGSRRARESERESASEKESDRARETEKRRAREKDSERARAK
jgi:hypothetical protein